MNLTGRSAEDRPHYGDGHTYRGVCECCGVEQSGPIARSRPAPFPAFDMFASKAQTLIMVVSERGGAHDLAVDTATQE